MKVKKYLKEFIEVYKQPSVKLSTFDSYRCLIPLIPEDWKVKKTDEQDVQRLINQLVRNGYSRSHIKHVVILLNMAFKKAYQQGKRKKPLNLDMLELPPNRPKEIHGLTPEAQHLLLANANKSQYGDLFCFLLLTGIRIGEALALDWLDYNPLNRQLHVYKTLYKKQLQPAKTKNSNRFIPLSDEAAAILEKKRGAAAANTVPIFVNSLGKRADARSVLDSFHRFQENVGIPKTGLHALRHSYASNALIAGVNPKLVSKLLGHSSVQVTLDIYTDVHAPQLAEAAQLISDSIFIRG